MTILPVGTYAKYPKAGEATGCCIACGGAGKVALGLGSGALSALLTYSHPRDIAAFILPDLGYDHSLDILALSLIAAPVVYAPSAPSERFSLLKAANLEVRVINSSLRCLLAGMELEFMRVGGDRYAVKVTEGGNSFVYAPYGDIAPCPFMSGASALLVSYEAANFPSPRTIVVESDPDAPAARELNAEYAKRGVPIELW